MLWLLACTSPSDDRLEGSDPPVEPSEQVDSDPWEGPEVSYNGPAYEPCVSEAQCGPGSACTYVPGFAGRYCAPPCSPGGEGLECDLDGALDFDTVCLDNGRCARVCDGGCPESLGCQAVDEVELCAGEPYGQAGLYGTCGHPNVAGTDCPEGSYCFGGDYIATDKGVCLPGCDDGTCPSPPEGTQGVSPLCYDVGYEHPLCPLLCVDGATCPEGQKCLDLGFTGLCAPEDAQPPDYDL